MSQTLQTSTMINITLPDGSKREVPQGTTPYDIAKSISPRLAEAALVAKVKPLGASAQPPAAATDGHGNAPASMHAPQSKDGWQFADLSKPLEQDVELRLRSEERRVGKECRFGWWAERKKESDES